MYKIIITCIIILPENNSEYMLITKPIRDDGTSGQNKINGPVWGIWHRILISSDK